jgi:hypothetical protein
MGLCEFIGVHQQFPIWVTVSSSAVPDMGHCEFISSSRYGSLRVHQQFPIWVTASSSEFITDTNLASSSAVPDMGLCEFIGLHH